MRQPPRFVPFGAPGAGVPVSDARVVAAGTGEVVADEHVEGHVADPVGVPGRGADEDLLQG